MFHVSLINNIRKYSIINIPTKEKKKKKKDGQIDIDIEYNIQNK